MQSVNLNMIPGSVMPVVNVTQFDEGREFGLVILNGTSAASLSGATLKINGRKQDDKGFSYDQTEQVKGQLVISVSGNVVTIRTTQQMTAVKGDTLTTLEIMFSTQDICTLNFILRCQENPLADVDISETDIPAIIDAGEQAAERAETAAASAEASATTASTAATNAGNSASAAATSATNAATSETNAAASETNAATSATYADTSADQAEASALKSEGHAIGKQNGTDVPSTSPYYHNNSAYWADQAAQSAAEAEQYAQGGLIYQGSIAFADIPTSGMKAGHMYNMNEDFTTDSRFQEGAGVDVKAGTDIAWNGLKWDLLAVGGVGELSGLSDVNITSAANKQGLVYDSTAGEWKNGDVLLKDGSVAANNLTVGSRATGSTVGTGSFANGNNAEASGSYSHAEGYLTKAGANYSHAEGYNTEVTGGLGGHAEGQKTTATGSGHAEGESSVHSSATVGIYASSGAHAEGYVNSDTAFIRATGSGAHAEGYVINAGKGNLASGTGSHAEGGNTTASGPYCHAEGSNTIASGTGSHAEGRSDTSGYYIKSSGYGSHAEGYASLSGDVIASGNGSHAEGYTTQATHTAAHAEGGATIASGEYSHAEGYHTTAGHYNHAQGHYNKAMTAGSYVGTTGDAMAIGNGSSSSLSNAFRVTYSGNVYGLAAFHSSGADYAEFFEWEDGNEENEDRVGYFVTLSGDKIKKATAGDYILGIISGQPSVIGNGDEDWLGRWQRDDFGRFIWGEIEEEDPTTKEKRKIRTILSNPAYDNTQEYIERKDRKEWDCVGMLGALAVRDDGTCEVNGFCGVKDGIATKAETGYRVIERVSDNVIRVIFR